MTVTNITTSSATVSASLNSLGAGASSVNQHGHCWSSETVTPVIDNNETNTTDTTYITIVKSTNQSGSSGGILGFEIEIPFPVVILFELISVIAVIALFLYWIKRK